MEDRDRGRRTVRSEIFAFASRERKGLKDGIDVVETGAKEKET